MGMRAVEEHQRLHQVRSCSDYISIYDIQRAVANKAAEWEMSNDEFGMSN
jgi:hypothetical protein